MSGEGAESGEREGTSPSPREKDERLPISGILDVLFEMELTLRVALPENDNHPCAYTALGRRPERTDASDRQSSLATDHCSRLPAVLVEFGFRGTSNAKYPIQQNSHKQFKISGTVSCRTGIVLPVCISLTLKTALISKEHMLCVLLSIAASTRKRCPHDLT
jgi:hypothetical protein